MSTINYNSISLPMASRSCSAANAGMWFAHIPPSLQMKDPLPFSPGKEMAVGMARWHDINAFRKTKMRLASPKQRRIFPQRQQASTGFQHLKTLICVGKKIHKLVFQTHNTSCFIFREFKDVLIEVNYIIQIRLGYKFYFIFFQYLDHCIRTLFKLVDCFLGIQNSI